MRNSGWIIILAAGALLTLVLSGLGQDALFRIHMGIVTVALGLGAVVLMRPPDQARVPSGVAEADKARYFDAPILLCSILPVFWGVLGMLVVLATPL